MLDTEPPKLVELSDATAASKPSPEKWSPKEELGHLLDSAANNHLRIVRTLLEDQPAMPKYEQERWVQMHAYQQRDWRELIDTWVAMNRQLLMVAASVPDADWTRTCTIGGAEPVTLKFVLQDYVAHTAHHLSRIKEAGWAAIERPSAND